MLMEFRARVYVIALQENKGEYLWYHFFVPLFFSKANLQNQLHNVPNPAIYSKRKKVDVKI